MHEPAIVCDALTRDFGDVRALDALTLSVPAGSIFAFLGPNGAGKTTTIHLLLGIKEPTSGAARVLGFDPTVSGASIRKRSGALLEHHGLYERLSAADNLRFYARIAGLERDEAEQRIADVLTRFGLYDRRDDAAGTWSRGMKQKLAIARALIHQPSLVFLDEPTAGLDPEATVALRRDIASLGETSTVFLTTHNLADVEKVATHVAIIRGGKLLDFGTPAELRARAVRTRITIRMSDREPLTFETNDSVAPVITQLVNEGAQIEEVRRDEPTIEDVFLHLVQREHAESNAAITLAAPATERRASPLKDIPTVIRKETKELSTGNARANTIAGVIFLAILAVLAGLIGEKLVASPALMSVTLVAFIILLASVADTFAGERERHTLETLLASAIPDEALLLGKIGASVLYGWLATLILIATLMLGARALIPLSTFLHVTIATPLMLIAFSTAGVLVSMHAPTVRAAQTRLSALLFGLMIPLVSIRPFVPRAWMQSAIAQLQTESGRITAIAGQILFFVVLDAVLLAVAVARFRRSRL
ncbi:MAG TPA: ATP-binding cassette domain-containing protein [Thermoanaerobaculia bacterium]